MVGGRLRIEGSAKQVGVLTNTTSGWQRVLRNIHTYGAPILSVGIGKQAVLLVARRAPVRLPSTFRGRESSSFIALSTMLSYVTKVFVKFVATSHPSRTCSGIVEDMGTGSRTQIRLNPT